MVKWCLYDFKTSKEEWFEEAEKVYLKKLKAFVPFEVIHLKTLKADREESSLKIKFEEKQLLEKLNRDDFVILFDEKGISLGSLEFASQLQKVSASGKKRLVFIIGGAFGVSEEIKAKANLKINLGSMTLNHLVAEVLVLEQLYRAQTIINRIPYHNL